MWRTAELRCAQPPLPLVQQAGPQMMKMARSAGLLRLSADCGLLPALTILTTTLVAVPGVSRANDTLSSAPVPELARVSDFRAAPCQLVKGPRHAVVAVPNADTLSLDNGQTLRLIGTRAPRSPDPDLEDSAWPPAVAALAYTRRLVLGRSVQLGFDAAREDRYGRVLAHVFVEPPTGTLGHSSSGPSSSDRRLIWLQAALVSSGKARAISFAQTRACSSQLIKMENAARRVGQGLWAHAAYAVRRATDTEKLSRHEGTLQIVEGRVREVRAVGRRTFINFGARWQDDFTLILEGRARTRFRRDSFDVTALAGRRIRVRGWIELWNGPAIRLTHPEEIEVVGGATQ